MKSDRLKNIIVLIISITFLFLVGEAITRISLYKTGNPYTIDYPLNSEGFRDYEYFPIKNESLFRIMVLGDSFTLGSGIQMEDSYPKVLEDMLNKKSKRFEVLNFGMAGYNVVQEAKLLETKGTKYSPDLVIIGHVLNDAETEQNRKYFDSLFSSKFFTFLQHHNIGITYFLSFLWIESESLLCKTMRDKFKKSCKLGIYPPDLYDDSSNGWLQEQEALKIIKRLSKENNFKTLLVIIPFFPIQDKADYPFFELHKKVEKFGWEQNFEVLDLYNAFNQTYSPRKMRLNIFDGHPNKLAHNIITQSIYQFLITSNMVSS